MNSRVLLILVILFCLTILAFLIRLLASNRSKDRINYKFEDKPPVQDEKDLDERVCDLLDADRKLDAIQLVRVEKKMRWQDAEDYVESFEKGIEFLPSEQELTPEELENKVFELLLQNRKTEAVELVRMNNLTGLEESAEFVEDVERKHGLV